MTTSSVNSRRCFAAASVSFIGSAEKIKPDIFGTLSLVAAFYDIVRMTLSFLLTFANI